MPPFAFGKSAFDLAWMDLGEAVQWIYLGDEYNGLLDLDVVGNHYEGRLVLARFNTSVVEVGFIKTEDLGAIHKLTLPVRVLEPSTGRLLRNEEIAAQFPSGYQHEVPIELDLGVEEAKLSWSAHGEMRGNLSAPNVNPTAKSNSEVLPITSWSDFTRWCSDLPESQFVFRGQSTRAKLRTSYHRTERSDLYRYVFEDLPTAHRALTGMTQHYFHRNDDVENGAFLNLLQHHGFPTPLLDWSESPFIAAYFAFRARRDRKDDHHEPVRILTFNSHLWHQDWRPTPPLTNVGPHVTMFYPLAIENVRARPQQALSMITNVDDIEAYVETLGSRSQHTYLTAIDLPYEERGEALKDLAMMGITQGTLFPGLDGTCEDLRNRFFGRI